MSSIRIPRALAGLVVVGALSLTGGCFFLPGGGGGGGGGGGCTSATTASFGTPFTVCLPDASSRVTVTVPTGSAVAIDISCDAGASDLLVKTVNADNFSCGSWNTNDAATRTITPTDDTVTFGVNPYINGGAAPGTATVTITQAP